MCTFFRRDLHSSGRQVCLSTKTGVLVHSDLLSNLSYCCSLLVVILDIKRRRPRKSSSRHYHSADDCNTDGLAQKFCPEGKVDKKNLSYNP